MGSDCYCFDDTDDELWVNVKMIERANEVGRRLMINPDDVSTAESSRISVLKVMEQESVGLRMIHPTTLLNLFNRRVHEDEIPLSRRRLLVEDGVLKKDDDPKLGVM